MSFFKNRISILKKREGYTFELPKSSFFHLFFWILTLINIGFWIFIKINPLPILFSLITWGLSTSFGLIILGKKRDFFNDKIVVLCLSFLIGMVAFTMVNFALFHTRDYNLVRVGNYIFFGFIGLIAFFNRRKTRAFFCKKEKLLFSPSLLLFLYFIITALTIVSVYGFNIKGASPQWGWNIDKVLHLRQFIEPIATHGWPVPDHKFTHSFVQFYYLGQNTLFGSYSFESIKDLYLFSGLPFYFITFYFLAFIGKRFFKLNTPHKLMLLLTCGAFLGAIDYPFFRLGQNSYLPMINFTGYYHNTTLWISNMIGFGGIISFLLFLKNEKRLFTLAMFLFIGSFLFKPSFFTVLAPAAFLLFPFYIKNFTLDKFFALLLGLSLVAFWILYPKLANIPPGDVKTAFSPFKVVLFSMRGRFPSFILKYKLIAFMVLMVFSFPLFIPITIDAFKRIFIFRKNKVLLKFRLNLKKHKVHLFFILMLLIGLLEKILFYEPLKIAHGNFGWASQSTQMAFLPLLVSLFYGIKTQSLRHLSRVILLWQLLNGFWKYVLFYMRKL